MPLAKTSEFSRRRFDSVRAFEEEEEVDGSDLSSTEPESFSRVSEGRGSSGDGRSWPSMVEDFHWGRVSDTKSMNKHEKSVGDFGGFGGFYDLQIHWIKSQRKSRRWWRK
eukprot:TRINITY_DN18886_c0_g1_i1.p2 TRINITY_DN18886_c0_g1~~TRINITY_DN18886_c0_g1_i1.p2  ORF type:complete len:110 (-),score=21.56 TRINITY_DN18886_c0_g1_i1:2-331(-)